MRGGCNNNLFVVSVSEFYFDLFIIYLSVKLSSINNHQRHWQITRNNTQPTSHSMILIGTGTRHPSIYPGRSQALSLSALLCEHSPAASQHPIPNAEFSSFPVKKYLPGVGNNVLSLLKGIGLLFEECYRRGMDEKSEKIVRIVGDYGSPHPQPPRATSGHVANYHFIQSINCQFGLNRLISWGR